MDAKIVYTSTEQMKDLFKEILYSSDGDFVIYCAFRNGIYNPPVEKPSDEDIKLAKEAVLSLFILALGALTVMNNSPVPAVSFISYIYYSSTLLYDRTCNMIKDNMRDFDIVRNAFAFRIYFYILSKFIEEFFFDEPLEVINISFDKTED